MQTDPVGYADSNNLYQYCGNNPTNYTDPKGLFGVNDLFNVMNVGIPFIIPPDLSLSLTELLKKKGERERTEEEECKKGRYYRHFTSYEGLEGILWSREIWASNHENLEYGPGVYLTDPGVYPGEVRITGSSGETWIDVWIPDTITRNPGLWTVHLDLNNPRAIQYVYRGGNLSIWIDPKHPPLTGPTLKE